MRTPLAAFVNSLLAEKGYKIPHGASAVLHSYLKQDMKFFVAKVNLTEQSKLGFTHLRPIQIAFESPKSMLPIRLGTINADGAQDLFIYTRQSKGASKRRTTGRFDYRKLRRFRCTSRISSASFIVTSSHSKCSAKANEGCFSNMPGI